MSHVKNLRYLAEMYADKALRDAADHIEHLEAEIAALKPHRHGTVAYARHHGPDDPPTVQCRVKYDPSTPDPGSWQPHCVKPEGHDGAHEWWSYAATGEPSRPVAPRSQAPLPFPDYPEGAR